jgi:hypothetical protein
MVGDANGLVNGEGRIVSRMRWGFEGSMTMCWWDSIGRNKA